MRTIKQAIVRADKRKLVARMALERVRAKAAGKHVDGTFAYGADPNRPEEVAILARMRQLRDAGLTCYRICKVLDAEGLKPSKAAKWQPNVVPQILERGKSDSGAD